ncbi:hypothetical protein [Streptomyces sp. NPDC048462]|uniref:hypothetical protein n=1 Tax=Streptomyces sp. NPDC048462 TaxID=3365555 RepID=UPI00371B76A0
MKPFHKRAVIVGALVLTIVTGGAVTYAVVSHEEDPGCGNLLGEKPVQRILGSEHRTDMSCADLGEALRRAATGPVAGQHTLAQAQNMHDTIMVINEDIQQRRQPTIAEGLRGPITKALADYAGDSFEMLTAINPDYNHRRDSGPWREGAVVRMPVPLGDLVRVMRAASDAPSAYATLRAAQTRECADGLGALPAKVTDTEFRGPARDCAAGLGRFDAIADDLPENKRQDWQKAVLAQLADTAPKAPPASYGDDPAEHIMRTWQQGFTGADPDESAFMDDDISRLIDIWVKGRGEDPRSGRVKLLRAKAAGDASGTAGDTAAALTCTRHPHGSSCPLL